MKSSLSRLSMKRFIGIIAILALGFIPAHSQQPMKDASLAIVSSIVADPDCQGLKNELIVVAEFENINTNSNALPRILQEMLITEFIKSKHFRVLERTQLAKALKEMNINTSDLFDPSYQKELGKYVGASYIVLGSISEMSNVQYLNARLVRLETGENITAADATVGEQTISQPSQSATTAGSSEKADIDTSGSKAVIPPKNDSSLAGTWVEGQCPSLWIAGNKDLRIAWREKLDARIYSFCAGCFNRDNNMRLASYEFNSDSFDGYNVYNPQKHKIVVRRWTGNKFKVIWESNPEYYFPVDEPCIRTIRLPDQGDCFAIGERNRATIDSDASYWFAWNGSTYYRLNSKSFRKTIVDSINGDPCKQVAVKLNTAAFTLILGESVNESNWEDSSNSKINSNQLARVTAADFDSDGITEFAIWKTIIQRSENGFKFPNESPIEFYASDEARKAVTESTYGKCMTNWNPGDVNCPFLVTVRNAYVQEGSTRDACSFFETDKVPHTGYFYIIQWDGETYNEIWRSNKLEEEILDMQVCDPKGEGKPGLVILSRDRANSYLTKIVAE